MASITGIEDMNQLIDEILEPVVKMFDHHSVLRDAVRIQDIADFHSDVEIGTNLKFMYSIPDVVTCSAFPADSRPPVHLAAPAHADEGQAAARPLLDEAPKARSKPPATRPPILQPPRIATRARPAAGGAGRRWAALRR